MRSGCATHWLLAGLLAGCDAGPTLYLGVPRLADASPAGPEDAGSDGDRDENDGDDEMPCTASSDCAALDKYPYCHAERGLCVTCLSDRHCDSDEYCDLDEGDCDDNR